MSGCWCCCAYCDDSSSNERASKNFVYKAEPDELWRIRCNAAVDQSFRTWTARREICRRSRASENCLSNREVTLAH